MVGTGGPATVDDIKHIPRDLFVTAMRDFKTNIGSTETKFALVQIGKLCEAFDTLSAADAARHPQGE